MEEGRPFIVHPRDFTAHDCSALIFVTLPMVLSGGSLILIMLGGTHCCCSVAGHDCQMVIQTGQKVPKCNKERGDFIQAEQDLFYCAGLVL